MLHLRHRPPKGSGKSADPQTIFLRVRVSNSSSRWGIRRQNRKGTAAKCVRFIFNSRNFHFSTWNRFTVKVAGPARGSNQRLLTGSPSSTIDYRPELSRLRGLFFPVHITAALLNRIIDLKLHCRFWHGAQHQTHILKSKILRVTILDGPCFISNAILRRDTSIPTSKSITHANKYSKRILTVLIPAPSLWDVVRTCQVSDNRKYMSLPPLNRNVQAILVHYFINPFPRTTG